MPNIPIKASNETWSEYELEDGTVVRVRPIVLRVSRDETQLNADGEPLYNVKAQILVDAIVPDGLKRKKN
jgi:hypothetical protein